MQNHPPNNPQDQNPYTQTNHDSSYMQQQLNQQLMIQQDKGIHFLNIMAESARRLGKHFGNVLLGWLIYIVCLTLFLIVVGYLLQLILVTALTGVMMSAITTGMTVAVIIKFVILILLVFSVILTAQMIFYFGFLSYISDLIELDSANYINIFSGFQKILQIFGLVFLVAVPVTIFAIVLAIPFGFFSGFSNMGNSNPRIQPNFSNPNSPSGLTQVQYNPDNPYNNPYQNPNQPAPNPYPGSSQQSPMMMNNPFTSALFIIYTIVLIAGIILYISKLILVPNLLIAQDMTLKEAVAESWNKVKGGVFLHVFMLLFALGIISICINFISSEYIAPAMLKGFSRWEAVKYAMVNNLIFQAFFVFFIGCIAHTYNKLYPLEYKTDTFAQASKYSRRTHPKYFQPIQAQGQQQNPAHGYNVPQQDPFASNYQSYSSKNNDIDSNILEPKTAPKPKQLLEVQEAANMYKTEKKKETEQNVQPQKQKIQYISEQPKPKAPEPEEFIVVEEHEVIQEPPKATVPKGHVSKFADKLFSNDDYPTGKIVPVDAMRMMKDKEVRFIEVLFQDVKHAHTTMRKIKVFHKNPDTGEYEIRDPLSFAISIPKISSNPVKLFFGGKDMTVKELWNAKEAIIEGMGKIVKMNRGDEK